MGKFSRDKGARGERLFRDLLRGEGFTAERGCQRQGGPDSPDVLCPSMPRIHWEIKRVERLNVSDALGQAILDAGTDRIPVVAHKRNHAPWLVTLRATDLLAIVRESSYAGGFPIEPTDTPLDPQTPS